MINNLQKVRGYNLTFKRALMKSVEYDQIYFEDKQE